MERCDLHGDNGDGKTRGFELACCVELGQAADLALAVETVVGLTSAVGSVDVASALGGTAFVGLGDIDEGSNEGKIDDHGDKRRECNTAKTADEQKSQNRIQHSRARNSFNGADCRADIELVVVQRDEEVGIDAEDDGSAAKLNASDEPL